MHWTPLFNETAHVHVHARLLTSDISNDVSQKTTSIRHSFNPPSGAGILERPTAFNPIRFSEDYGKDLPSLMELTGLSGHGLGLLNFRSHRESRARCDLFLPGIHDRTSLCRTCLRQAAPRVEYRHNKPERMALRPPVFSVLKLASAKAISCK